MISKRAADTRWRANPPFIDTRRTFSFPPYWDPAYINYGDLQTINDDRVQRRWQVPWHEHRNMEIFGYVVQGSSHHVDSLGNDVEVPAGAVQRMSSGRGISHTEGNTADSPNRYLQLWIRPNQQDVEPRHDWYQFSREDKLNQFCDITQKLPIYSDARLLAGIFSQQSSQELATTRRYYAYVVRGAGHMCQHQFVEGDGFMFEQENHVTITPDEESEVIVFDLAA